MTLVGGNQHICEWCGRPLNANQLVACGADHRLLRWQWLHGVSFRADGTIPDPPSQSVLLLGSGPLRASQSRLNGSGRAQTAPSGLQVPYVKALQVLVEDLSPFVEAGRVEAALRRALPERQRRTLEERAA